MRRERPGGKLSAKAGITMFRGGRAVKAPVISDSSRLAQLPKPRMRTSGRRIDPYLGHSWVSLPARTDDGPMAAVTGRIALAVSIGSIWKTEAGLRGEGSSTYSEMVLRGQAERNDLIVAIERTTKMNTISFGSEKVCGPAESLVSIVVWTTTLHATVRSSTTRLSVICFVKAMSFFPTGL